MLKDAVSIFLFSLVFVFSRQLSANHLCEYIIGKYDGMIASGTLTDKQVVSRVVRRLTELGKKRWKDRLTEEGPISNPKDFYERIRSEPRGAETFHSVYQKAKNIRKDDSSSVLQLPQRGRPTIWQQLSVSQRIKLVKTLEEQFLNSIYDMPGTIFNPDGTEFGYRDSNHEDDEMFDKFVTRIIPILYYGAIREGQSKKIPIPAGVCRHSNLVLAGLLGELGVPPEDIRLVTGKNYGQWGMHIWIEYRADTESDWEEADGTAALGPGDDLLKPGMVFVRNRKKFHEFRIITKYFSPVRYENLYLDF